MPQGVNAAMAAAALASVLPVASEEQQAAVDAIVRDATPPASGAPITTDDPVELMTRRICFAAEVAAGIAEMAGDHGTSEAFFEFGQALGKSKKPAPQRAVSHPEESGRDVSLADLMTQRIFPGG